MMAFGCKADSSVCLEGICLKCSVFPHKAAIKHVRGDSSEEGGNRQDGVQKAKGLRCGRCV